MQDCGRLVKTWGHRGNLVLDPTCRDWEGDLPLPCSVILNFPRREEPHQLEGLRDWGGRWLVSFRGISEIGAAYRLVGAHLLVPEGLLAPVAEASWVGYSVIDQNGSLLGHVVLDRLSERNPLLEVVSPEGHTYLLPAPEAWRIRVDEQTRELVLRLPEGLLDL